MSYDIEVHPSGSTVLKLRRALSGGDENELRKRLDGLYLLIDLTHSGGLDIESLMRLIRLGRRFEARGGAFAFSGLPAAFQEALRVNGLDDFPSFDQPARALAWLAGQNESRRRAQAAESLMLGKAKPAAAPLAAARETPRLELALRLLGASRADGA